MKTKRVKDESNKVETERIGQITMSKEAHINQLPTFQDVNGFETCEPKKITAMVTQMPRDVTEINIVDETIYLGSGHTSQQPVTTMSAPNVIALTHEIISAESEIEKSFLLSSNVNINHMVQDESTSIEVHTVNTVDTLDNLETGSFQAAFQAFPCILPENVLITSEVVAAEHVDKMNLKPGVLSNARVNYVNLNVPSVRENCLVNTEEQLQPHKERRSQVRVEILPHNTFEVIKVDQFEVETDMPVIETLITTGGTSMSPIDHIEVSETISESIPEKYYPEIVVPTEVASISIPEKTHYQSLEISPTEHIIEYKSSEKVKGQTATEKLLHVDYINIQQTTVTENTSDFKSIEFPSIETASDSMNVFEAVEHQVTAPLDQLVSSSEIDNLLAVKNSAKIEFNALTSNITNKVQILESTENIKPAEYPITISANTKFIMHDSTTRIENAAFERETKLDELPVTNMNKATSRIIPYQELLTSESLAIEMTHDRKCTNTSKTEQAKIDIGRNMCAQSFTILPSEAECGFYPNPASFKTVSISNTESLNSALMECNQPLESEGSPCLNKFYTCKPLVTIPNPIKVGVIEECCIVDSVKECQNELRNEIQAHPCVALANETIVSSVMPDDSIDFDGLKYLDLNYQNADVDIDTKNALEIAIVDLKDPESTEDTFLELPICRRACMNTQQALKSIEVEDMTIFENTEDLTRDETGEQMSKTCFSESRIGIIVTENFLIEDTPSIDGMRAPASHANSTCEGGTSVCITETDILDTTKSLNLETLKNEGNAISSVTKNVCQIQIEQNRHLIEPVALQSVENETARAKITRIPHLEKTVNEKIIFEGANVLETEYFDRSIGKPLIDELKHITTDSQTLYEHSSTLNERISTEPLCINCGTLDALSAAETAETYHKIVHGLVDENLRESFIAKPRLVESIGSIEFSPEYGHKYIDARTQICELRSIEKNAMNIWEAEGTIDEKAAESKEAIIFPSHSLKCAEQELTQPLDEIGHLDKMSFERKFPRICFDERRGIESMVNPAFDSIEQYKGPLLSVEQVAKQVIGTYDHYQQSINFTSEENIPLNHPGSIEETIRPEMVSSNNEAIINEELIPNESCFELLQLKIPVKYSENKAHTSDQVITDETVTNYDVKCTRQYAKEYCDVESNFISQYESKTLDTTNDLNETIAKPRLAESRINDKNVSTRCEEAIAYETVVDIESNTEFATGKPSFIPNVMLETEQLTAFETHEFTDNPIELGQFNARIEFDSIGSVSRIIQQPVENVFEIDTRKIEKEFVTGKVTPGNDATYISINETMESTSSFERISDERGKHVHVTTQNTTDTQSILKTGEMPNVMNEMELIRENRETINAREIPKKIDIFTIESEIAKSTKYIDDNQNKIIQSRTNRISVDNTENIDNSSLKMIGSITENIQEYHDLKKLSVQMGKYLGFLNSSRKNKNNTKLNTTRNNNSYTFTHRYTINDTLHSTSNTTETNRTI